MIRKTIFPKDEEKRNYDIQRIEAFSDGVFAFAVTLLIVSLEVPKNFEELMVTMRGFFAFGASFLLLVFIWREQHSFFRSYGLGDNFTIIVNAALLFIVLYYVYPLKFVFTMLFRNQIYGPGKSPLQISQEEVPSLMTIYALGFISIYTLFFFMYLHAYRNRHKLQLNTKEIFDCKTSIYKQVIMASIGLLSLIFARTMDPGHVNYSGAVYLLFIPAFFIFFRIRSRTRMKLI